MAEEKTGLYSEKGAVALGPQSLMRVREHQKDRTIGLTLADDRMTPFIFSAQNKWAREKSSEKLGGGQKRAVFGKSGNDPGPANT